MHIRAFSPCGNDSYFAKSIYLIDKTDKVPCAILEWSDTNLELRNQVGILTLRRAILEWYRFPRCAEHIYYSIYPLGPIVPQDWDILDGDRERHPDHNRNLSRQSVSVRDDARIRTCMRVPHRHKSETPSVMIVSGLHSIVDSIGTILSKCIRSYLKERPDRGRSCHQKLSNRDHITSKRDISYQKVSTRITSYLNLKFQRNPTISYEWTIVAFVTDCTTVGTPHEIYTNFNA